MQCSQTKGFCGVTIAKLVEDGKISLDDPVSKYLPEFSELWVLDEDNRLAGQLNTGHVKDYAVTEKEAEELKQLLTMHEKATGSGKAREILEDFDHYLPKFRTVISDEYLASLKGA